MSISPVYAKERKTPLPRAVSRTVVALGRASFSAPLSAARQISRRPLPYNPIIPGRERIAPLIEIRPSSKEINEAAPANIPHRQISLETISPRETKLWAFTSILCSIGTLVWGLAASTMGTAATVFFGLGVVFTYVLQRSRLSELKYQEHFPALTAQEKEVARSPSAPKVAILIPAYHEPPEILTLTILSAALQDYANRDVYLLNDNDPAVPSQQIETRQIRQNIKGINSMFLRGERRVLRIYEKYWGQPGLDLKAGCRGVSRAANYIARQLEGLDHFLGRPQDLTESVTRDRIFLSRARHFVEMSEKFGRLSSQDNPGITAQEVEGAWSELLIFFKVKVRSFERKSFANLPKTRNKATNINAFLSLEGGEWILGYDAGGRKVILLPDSPEAEVLSGARKVKIKKHDYFLIVDADNRIFPEYLSEAIPFMEREVNQEVSIFQSPTWSLPSAKPAQHITAFQMNKSGLLEKGFAVQGSACWGGSNGVLRRRVLESLAEQPADINKSPYKKFIRDDTVIEDYETDLQIKLANPRSRTVYSSQPLCILINPESWGEVEIQQQRWSNGPLILFQKILRFGRHLSMGVILNRAWRYLQYGVNIIITLGAIMGIGSFAGNPLLYLYLITSLLSIYRPLQKRGFTFKDSQMAIIWNWLLAPTYIKGHISTIRQMITGKKIPFARTPKDGSRSRISLASSFFALGSLGYLLTELGPAVMNLMANGNLAINALQLYTFGLLSYTVHKFMGFKNIFQDSIFQLRAKARLLINRLKLEKKQSNQPTHQLLETE